MRVRRARTDRPYERRRTRPIVITAIVLAAVAVVAWTAVLSTASSGPSSTNCAAPASGALPGSEITRVDLDGVAAAAPNDARFQVLNAGGQRGQANLVAAQLKDFEFGEANTPGNDPAFPEGDLDCIGQMRFGADGEAAAATLSLALPCVELIRDDRPGAVVDVVVGTAFTDVAPSRTARDALDQLAAPGSEGAAQADPGLLAQARENVCS
ncbi:envelope integrity protein Cei [Pseudonocardia parietis]|uniref:LytR/CpsA/Psr regulator C-terminal domain-containing protein n=1 Tax=Pseudonocardia parietis TaxID=570936 RepID=A0ABS4VYM7_9PSEU|nr:envelope integrity protein Cei [Pseudonocardia parietis]MBP2369058.1 hypothetical protein [Pseudonocardia parietis]